MIQLIPSQEAAYRVLKYGYAAGNLLVLRSHSGRGRTTVLRKLHEELGGGFVSAKDFIETSMQRDPLSLEESLYSAIISALNQNQVVFVDDIDLIHDATSSCHFYPRGRYIETTLLALTEAVARDGKKLIVSTDGSLAESFSDRSFLSSISRYTVEDYAALFELLIGKEAAAALDVQKIYRFAPKLNGHQLRAGCDWLRPTGRLTTEQFIEYLRSQKLASNVDLGEVQEVDLHELQGVDDV